MREDSFKLSKKSDKAKTKDLTRHCKNKNPLIKKN